MVEHSSNGRGIYVPAVIVNILARNADTWNFNISKNAPKLIALGKTCSQHR